MKAKTFIEYWKSPITEVMSIHKAYDLLSRPFKPEDITELFEKINSFDKQNFYIGNIIGNHCHFYIPNKKNIFRIRTEEVRDGYRASNLFQESRRPTTLDQFISDCSRSGIELFWKDSIVKEYFK